MNTRAHKHAFTLIELLVVISIIAIIAGLVVGLAAAAGKDKRQKRVRVELAKLVTLIETYKSKVGVYPPDNRSNPDRNSLLYELAGTIRDSSNPADPKYITPFPNIEILRNDIWNVYGGLDVFPSADKAGFINAVDSQTDPDAPKVHRILTTLKPDQFATVAGGVSLVVPVDGPNGRPNPWHYRRGNPDNPNDSNLQTMHNPGSFDLWVDIIAGGQTNRIGNWKN